MIAQVQTAINIAEPKMQNTFLISSGRCAYSDDVPIAHTMNVSDGGKQSFMRDTIWHGKPQKMVT